MSPRQSNGKLTILRRFQLFYFHNSIIFIFIALIVVSGILSDKFFTFRNWMNILTNFSVLGIVACGVSLVLIAGGIDLSFGSILACCAVFAAYLQPKNFLLAMFLPPLLGTTLGMVNGLIVTQLRTNPLITTLGTQWAYFAALMIVTEGHLVQGKGVGPFHYIGNGKIYGISMPFVIFFVVGLCVYFVLTRTVFGKYVYAHGSNKEALFCSGVNTSALYWKIFVAMGFIVGIGGVVLSSRLIGVRPTEGGRYLINVLTAVILGGVSLSGGVGSVLNVMIAVLTLGVIDNAMVLFGVAYKDQQIIRGSIFILSVIYNGYLLQRSDLLRKTLAWSQEELSSE